MMRFGPQEYVLMTGLKCGLFPEGDNFDRFIERKRLKERCFKSNDKISLAQLQSTVARSSTIQVDCYKLGLVLIVEGVFNVPDNNVSFHLPTLSFVDDLDFFLAYPWSRLHVYAILHPHRCRGRAALFLHSCRTMIPCGAGGQSGKHDSDDKVSSGGSGEDDRFGDDDSDGQLGSDRDDNDNKDHNGDHSEDTDVHGRGIEPCPDEHDMAVHTGRLLPLDGVDSASCPDETVLLVGTKHLLDETDIAPCLDDDRESFLTPIDDPQGVVTEVPVPASVLEAGGRITTTR
ncbi:Hypothetical predicted protein [Olea europaea subsp. europaea]|uniref:DUF1985 domain-containing protein n=1 Tax=Olea europaea subsp. europaea TaxID=158383 RepID=A0A8S0RL70_OLEEU|nr:Hypothetical predicted protein [Olea europaea subsp. europaea]